MRPVGYETEDGFVKVPEMIPDLIVPDLTGFKVAVKYSYTVKVRRFESIIHVVFVDTERFIRILLLPVLQRTAPSFVGLCFECPYK